MNLNDLVDYCRAEAIAAKLYSTEEAEWRFYCRVYSKAFHTALHLVEAMDPEYVLLRVFENGMDELRLRKYEHFESIVEQLRRIEDPNYDATREKEFDDFATGIEQWEAQRQAEGKPLPKKQGPSVEEQVREQASKKTHGFIDLSYLENSKDER